MTVKEFIEAAIEGGWNPKDSFGLKLNIHNISGEIDTQTLFRSIYRYVLDPEAWKAVGKVKEWKNGVFPYQDEFVNGYRLGFVAPYEEVDFVGEYWQYAMHLMIIELIKGRTIEEYIATL